MLKNETQVLSPELSQEIVSTLTAYGSLIQAKNFPQFIRKVTEEIAKPLAKIIKDNGLYLQLKKGDKPFVYCDGWTTMGVFLGIFPHTIETKYIQEGARVGYQATVELKTMDGKSVGRAVSNCSKTEAAFINKPLSACESMAQTRATGKAFRQSFSWIMILAGYSPTPAEEVQSLPIDQQKTISTTKAPENKITNKQISDILKLIKNILPDDEAKKTFFQDNFAKKTITELTGTEAEDCLKKLQGLNEGTMTWGENNLKVIDAKSDDKPKA